MAQVTIIWEEEELNRKLTYERLASFQLAQYGSLKPCTGFLLRYSCTFGRVSGIDNSEFSPT